MSYKLVQGKHGIRFMKDGKFIAKDKVPQIIQDELKVGEILPDPVSEIVDVTIEREKENRYCLFCHAYTTWKRVVNGQSIAICEAHYYDTNIGQIAQKVRETVNV